jgi:hypothetical protein
MTGAVSVDSGIRIWQGLVRPVLEYGAEVWPMEAGNWEEADRLQRKMARRILGCQKNTPDEALRGELGWWTLKARRTMLRLRYWWKLANMGEDRLVRRVYIHSLNRSRQGNPNWCSVTESLMTGLGLETEWDNGCEEGAVLGTRQLWAEFIGLEIHKQQEDEWRTTMDGKSSLDEYAKLKSGLQKEAYLKSNLDPDGRMAMTRVRTGYCGLMVNLGRAQVHRPERKDRLCPLCEFRPGGQKGRVEDGKHVLVDCLAYKKIREKMWKKRRKITNTTSSGVSAWEELMAQKDWSSMNGEERTQQKRLDEITMEFWRKAMAARARLVERVDIHTAEREEEKSRLPLFMRGR